MKMNSWFICQHTFIEEAREKLGEHERLGTLSSQDGNAKEDFD